MNHSTSDKSLGYGFLFMPPIMPQLGQMRNLYITLQTPSKEAIKAAGSDETPSWIFLGRYSAGAVEMVGGAEKSPVARTAYEFLGLDPAWIGDSAVELVEGLEPQIQEWADAWKNGGNGNENGNGNGNGNSDGNDVAPPSSPPQTQSDDDATSTTRPRDPNAPASPAQWDLIKKLLDELGYAEARHNAAIVGVGYDPAALSTSGASDLITRLLAAKNKSKNGAGNGNGDGK